MATQPTNLSVPSESPRDLKFNAGKIDEFVTSLALQYIDRFGNAHYTIEGLKQLVLQQIYNLGWNTVGTFQDGAIISAAGDIIQDESTGVWYRWDDLSTLPKSVPAGSTPDSTGGVGEGKWLAVDVSDILRKQLAEDDGALLIGNFASSAGVISAKLYGVKSGIDCAPIIQQLQDLSESLRLPIDFSGIAEIRFTGRVQIGDWFYWKGAGRFNTVIKPLSLTQSTVGNNGGNIYAWFDRKDSAVNLDFFKMEDIGFDGQYQDGYELSTVAPTKLIHVAHIFCSGSAVGRNISFLRVGFKDSPGNAIYLHVEGGGKIDGVWAEDCSTRGTDPYKTSIFFNFIKSMNGTTDAPGVYGVYPIRNIFSRGNISYGNTRMHDLSRGTERVIINDCETYEMNDCHHSADGARSISMGPNLIGSQSGISFNTKNFIELQAEDVVIHGGTYRATSGTGNAGQAGIFVADFKYGSEALYHQSKNIRIHNFKAYNVNSDAVRLNNVANVLIDNVSADSCNGAAVSWEVITGHIDFITNAEIIPSNNTQGNIITRGCLLEVRIPISTSDVTIIGVAKNSSGLSRYATGNFVYQTGKPYKIPNASLKNNDRLLTLATSSAPAKTDATSQPVGVMYAFTLNDTNTSAVQSMPVASIPITTSGNVFFDMNVLKGTATAAAVIFKEVNASGAVVNTAYLNAYVTTAWTKRSYIYVPVNAACAGVTIELAPACDTSGTASLTGTTSFADLQISDLPV